MKPLVGITCCTKLFGLFGTPNHAASDTYVRAMDQVVGAVPVLLPANGDAADIGTLLARLDGLVLTGSRSNVQPSLYGGPPHPEGIPEDHARDGAILPLIRAAIARGVPLLAICRGFQELNVALGGTLHQQVHRLPGRLDHRSDPGTMEHKFRLKHNITLTGQLARMVGATEIMVNSLHGQAIDRPADGLVVEATAPDGTIEAVRVASAPGWAFGVQFHPEWHFAHDAPSRAIFRAFGEACAVYAAGMRRAA